VIRTNQKPLSPSAFRKAVTEGALILDTRPADDFEKGHIPGAINIGLNGQFAVWVGTLLNINRPLVLVTEPGKEHESILRLARVGYEKVIGFLAGGIAGWDEKLDVVRSIEAAEVYSELKKGDTILDVRKPGEWNTAHLKDAEFFPLSDFPSSLDKLQKETTFIVHCGGGYRSMTAISIMKNHGFKNLINVYGGFAAMQKAGLDIVSEAVPAS
jgi:hydroxyacylglutathione hydrolase